MLQRAVGRGENPHFLTNDLWLLLQALIHVVMTCERLKTDNMKWLIIDNCSASKWVKK